jgi:acyl carrier protein
LGADECETVELAIELEEEFDVEIPEENWEGLDTVIAILDYLHEGISSLPKD